MNKLNALLVALLLILVSSIGLNIFLLKKIKKTKDNSYAQYELLMNNDSASKAEYEDSISFLSGQLSLQYAANTAHLGRIRELENEMNVNYAKHNITKKQIKQTQTDTAGQYAMLVPNEYVDQCEACFAQQQQYIRQNKQLIFERDSYDSLLKMQNGIDLKRIWELEKQDMKLAQIISNTRKEENTRKVKISVAGQLNNLFIPNGGGPGLIYEDKKFNEFGTTVMFTGKGNIYIFHIAKTISLKHKK